MNKLHMLVAVATCVFLSIATSTKAALMTELGGAVVYDTDLKITWLANANLAETNNFGVTGIASDGAMSWGEANSWIAAMNADGGNGYLGFSDWRLPFTPQVDATCSQTGSSGSTLYSFAWSCTGSEMGHLYYEELDGTIINPISTSSDPDLELFDNIQGTYWSNEATHTSLAAWTFAMDEPGLGGFTAPYLTTDVNSQFYVWAVRDGNVVPIPAAVWLFGSGLLGLIGVARREKA